MLVYWCDVKEKIGKQIVSHSQTAIVNSKKPPERELRRRGIRKLHDSKTNPGYLLRVGAAFFDVFEVVLAGLDISLGFKV